MNNLTTTENDLITTGKPSWYAVYTKPREEDRAESNLSLETDKRRADAEMDAKAKPEMPPFIAA